MLGLNNAATPLGIKAMEEPPGAERRQGDGHQPDGHVHGDDDVGCAVDSVVDDRLLAAAGSTSPTAIIAPGLVATFIGTVAAVVAAKLLQRVLPCAGRAPSRRAPNDSRRARRDLDLGRAGDDRRHPAAGLIRKVKVYDVFIEGAKEGFDVAVKIIPFLVGILVAIGMFRGSGAMELLLAALRPVAPPPAFPPSSSRSRSCAR